MMLGIMSTVPSSTALLTIYHLLTNAQGLCTLVPYITSIYLSRGTVIGSSNTLSYGRVINRYIFRCAGCDMD